MNKFFFPFILSTLFLSVSIQALNPNSFASKEEADSYLYEHYRLGREFYNSEDWEEAANHFERITYFFPDDINGPNAFYFLGVCFYKMKEYDFANIAFTNYLKTSEHPEFFEDVMQYKFCIAEFFKSGSKRRLFKVRYCPKWATSRTLALKIYDEIILTVPNREISAKALFSKGELLHNMGLYRESVDAYQTLIRRFPRYELVPEAYLNIVQNYYEQSRYEFQNPDLLGLAELNARKFKEDFPKEERVLDAENYVCRIKEMYAKGLYDLGRFYIRMDQPEAAVIYFRNVIEEFPDTQIAGFSRQRLQELNYDMSEDEEEQSLSELPQSE